MGSIPVGIQFFLCSMHSSFMFITEHKIYHLNSLICLTVPIRRDLDFLIFLLLRAVDSKIHKTRVFLLYRGGGAYFELGAGEVGGGGLQASARGNYLQGVW